MMSGLLCGDPPDSLSSVQRVHMATKGGEESACTCINDTIMTDELQQCEQVVSARAEYDQFADTYVRCKVCTTPCQRKGCNLWKMSGR